MDSVASLLPAVCASTELETDLSLAWLDASESSAVRNARDTRRREFATARECARRALRSLGGGADAVPVLTGSAGEPLWPTGIIGSITHCAGYRAAAVATVETTTALGIDAEPDQPLPDGVAGFITSPPERDHLAGLAAAESSGPHWPTLLFSAKESLYKAWFPFTGLPAEFTDCTIHLERSGTFTAQLEGDLAGHPRFPAVVSGRWCRRGDLLLTAVWLPGDAARPRHADGLH